MPYRSVFVPGLFAGRTVIVTGGGSGIGRCTAHELAALGAHVVLIGRNTGKLEAVEAEIRDDGGRANWHAADIRDEAHVRETVAAIVAAHGRIDALVNNAGGQYISPLENISAKGWMAVINTNLTGGFFMMRECYLQSMREHGGAVVNIVADMWGAMPNMAHSGAARAGMVSLTETAAVEWGASGVRVNAVAPGYVASSGLDHYPPEHAEMMRRRRETLPLGRVATEAEISAAIVFLLGPAANFITGTTLRVDGGRPQVRLGWPLRSADAAAQQRDAIRPFQGFHRAVAPKVYDEPGSTPAA